MKKAMFIGLLGAAFTASAFANVVWSPVSSVGTVCN